MFELQRWENVWSSIEELIIVQSLVVNLCFCITANTKLLYISLFYTIKTL